jgi:hypothetical protein
MLAEMIRKQMCSFVSRLALLFFLIVALNSVVVGLHSMSSSRLTSDGEAPRALGALDVSDDLELKYESDSKEGQGTNALRQGRCSFACGSILPGYRQMSRSASRQCSGRKVASATSHSEHVLGTPSCKTEPLQCAASHCNDLPGCTTFSFVEVGEQGGSVEFYESCDLVESHGRVPMSVSVFEKCAIEDEARIVDSVQRWCQAGIVDMSKFSWGPMPFKRNDSKAFIPKMFKGVKGLLDSAAKNYRDQLCDRPTRILDVTGLLRAGLKWNSVGMNFDEVWQRCPGDIEEFLNNSQLISVQKMYFAPRERSARKVLGKMWKMDSLARYRPHHVKTSAAALMPKSVFDLLRSLRENGYALVDDWGLDMGKLSAEYDGKMKSFHKPNWAVKSYPVKLQSIEPLLRNKTLNNVITSYLGIRNMSAVLEGYVALRLENTLTLENYVSGIWHHDRCGRRLKAFVFMHDIDPRRGRPTTVAKGSHNTFYYDYHEMDTSRYNHTWVTENYKEVKMVGKRGGGFIFDTNALHYGMVEGSIPRNTIILEYHGYSKVPTLAKSGHNGPCPSKVFTDRRELSFEDRASESKPAHHRSRKSRKR